MPFKHKINSYKRRHLLANQIYRFENPTIRPYFFYIGRHVLCVTSPQFDYCEQCLRYNRYCELASPFASEVARFHEKDRRLFEGALTAETKTLRFCR
jgi:hypothetical protein